MVASGPSFWRNASLGEASLTWLATACLALGIGYLVVTKTISKYSRGQLASLGPTTVLLSLAALVVFFFAVAPAVLVTAHNVATSNSPNRALASAVAAVGLVDDATCSEALRTDFSREARLAWLNQPAAEEIAKTDEIPFTYGACGEQYTDDAVAFPDAATEGTIPEDEICPSPSELASEYAAVSVPAFCAPDRDTTGGWAARIAAVLALLTTVATIVRGMTGQGDEKSSTRLGRLIGSLRQAVLPWTALAIVAAAATILTLRLLQHFLVDGNVLNSWWVWAVFLVYLALRVVSDATTSSLHPFYRERISETFFVKRQESKVSTLAEQDKIDVSQGADDDPGLTVLCVANVQDVDYVPAQRGCVTFRFQTGRADPAFIGITDRRLPMIHPATMSAATYSRHADPTQQDTTLASAVAASGAAFSPVVGRLSRRIRPYRIVLTLANARLGVWLPNPYAALTLPNPPDSPSKGKLLRRRFDKPGAFRILKEAFGRQSIYDEFLYVTDGGHFDNTGIVEALRDRPSVLVVLDASADAVDNLDALADAMTTARMDLSLIIEPADGNALEQLLTPRATEEDPLPRPEKPWLHLRATELAAQPGANPIGYTCDIFFVKNVLSEGPDLELDSYRREHPEFPITTTVNQFYGEYDFEAYRQLGWRNMDMMLAGES